MNPPQSPPPAFEQDAILLGHYQLRGRLGEGGFGEVFEAWDSKLQRSVAIKRLKNSSALPEAEGLIKEARLAASLKHAAFVKIHAIEDEGNSQSIVMELVRGVTLKQWIKREPTDEKRALEIIQQVAEAMQEAHASGLIHGDLKPSNLIVEPSGKVRILDFGLASKGDPQATTSLSQSDPQGTIAYMAPERFTGGSPNAQSDIYALGAILYEMLNGSRPFETLSGLALAAAHVQSSSDQWSYPAHISPPVVQLIRRMTARSVETRTASMAVVAEVIAAMLGGVATSVAPVQALPQRPNGLSSKWQRLSKTIRRRIVVGVGILAIGFAGWKAMPYAELSFDAWKPYSESVTMKQGLDALKLFDRRGSLDIATKSFETILKYDANNAAAVAGLSMVYTYRYVSDAQDEIWQQKADAAAQHALNLNDQLSLSHVAKAFVMVTKGKRDDTLALYEKALALDPSNIFAYFGKFESLLALRRLDQANEVALEGRQRFPQERVFLDGIGSVFYQRGDYKNAELAFRESIQLQPDAVFAYANLSIVLSRLDKNEEALQILQQGLQIRPSAPLYTALGATLFQRGEFVAAASAFEQAVSPTKGNPAKYSYWGNLGDTLLWIPGRKPEALVAYKKALELLQPKLARSPNDVVLVSRMSLYAARVGEKKQATDFAERAVKMAPNSPDVHFRAALAHELLGNRTLALEAIGNAKSLGYPVKMIEAEPDLVALRRDPAY